MSNQPPIEVPQGAIRLNTDSQKLEFFAQDRWYEMATDIQTLDGGARGIWGVVEMHNQARFMQILNILLFQQQEIQLILDQIYQRVKEGVADLVHEREVLSLLEELQIIDQQ